MAQNINRRILVVKTENGEQRYNLTLNNGSAQFACKVKDGAALFMDSRRVAMYTEKTRSILIYGMAVRKSLKFCDTFDFVSKNAEGYPHSVSYLPAYLVKLGITDSPMIKKDMELWEDTLQKISELYEEHERYANLPESLLPHLAKNKQKEFMESAINRAKTLWSDMESMLTMRFDLTIY